MTNTTATWGSTGTCSFTSGQVAESLSVDYNNGTITEATLDTTETSGTFRYFMSASGNTSQFNTGTFTNNLQSNIQFTSGTVGNYALDLAGQVVVVNKLSGSDTISTGKSLSFQKIAQSFVYPTYTVINAIRVRRVAVTGTPTGDLVFAIQADSGGNPSGTDLATRTMTLDVWNAMSTSADTFFNIDVTGLTGGNTYWLVVRVSSGNSNTNYYNLVYDSTGVYGSLKQWTGLAWSAVSGTLRFDVEYAGYISLASAITLTYNSWSVSWWMKRDTNSYECIFSNASGSSGQIEIDSTSNKLRFESKTNNVYVNSAIPTGITTSDGAWHHYVLTSGASNMNLWVDGVNTWSKGSALDDTVDQTFQYIGRRQNSPNGTYGLALNGQLDEIRWYNRELSSSDVASLYAKSEVSNGLINKYELEENSGTHIYDTSNWENVTKAVSHTFNYTGTDLRWKIIENGGSTGAITSVTINGYH